MQLVLEKRAERSNTIALISPLIAIRLTIVSQSRRLRGAEASEAEVSG